MIFFGRLPAMGRCKTRLAKTVGGETAKELYRLCCERVLNAFFFTINDVNAKGEHACDLTFSCEDARDVDEVKAWVMSTKADANNNTHADDMKKKSRINVDVTAQSQATKNLGDRLICAMNNECVKNYDVVAVVGTDYPNANAEVLLLVCTKIMEEEDDRAVAFGEAQDGGFWFVATTNELPTNAFDGVRWSTEYARKDALRSIEKCGFKTLNSGKENGAATLHDIDTAEDLVRWAKEELWMIECTNEKAMYRIKSATKSNSPSIEYEDPFENLVVEVLVTRLQRFVVEENQELNRPMYYLERNV